MPISAVPDTRSVAGGAVLDIFRRELRDPALVVESEMETGSIDGWDSFANVEILLACETHWGIHFTASEIDGIRSFGDLVRAVEAKLA